MTATDHLCLGSENICLHARLVTIHVPKQSTQAIPNIPARLTGKDEDFVPDLFGKEFCQATSYLLAKSIEQFWIRLLFVDWN